MHDLLHSAEREWLGDAFANLSQDHRHAAAWQPRKDRLGILIEFHDSGTGPFLQRMPNNSTGLVVFDLDRIRPFLAAVVSPSQIAGQDVLWPLKPLKADHRGCGGFGLSAVNAAPGKLVNLLSRGRAFCFLRTPPFGDTLPRIRNVAIELTWMQAMNNTPSATTERDGLLALA